MHINLWSVGNIKHFLYSTSFLTFHITYCVQCALRSTGEETGWKLMKQVVDLTYAALTYYVFVIWAAHSNNELL